LVSLDAVLDVLNFAIGILQNFLTLGLSGFLGGRSGDGQSVSDLNFVSRVFRPTGELL
jgi:hypothetical protein